MYQVTKERARGPFRVLKKRTTVGEIDISQDGARFSLPNGIELSSLVDSLLIQNTGAQLFRIDFRAQPQMRLPRITDILSPDHPCIRTSRSHITITPLEEGNNEMIIIQSREPQPLVMSKGEVRAMIMGIETMRPGLEAEYARGRKSGLDEGNLQGSQPHPTNL